MSKRVRPQKLRLASKVGWHAEFPTDLWNVIIEQLPYEKDKIPDLGLMLTLMGVSKAVCSLFKEKVLALLCDISSCVLTHDSKHHGKFLGRLQLFLKEARAMDYIRHCLTDKAYQTPEHLTNCVSLLHLGRLEMRYLKPYKMVYGEGRDGRPKYAYEPLEKLIYSDRIYQHQNLYWTKHVKTITSTKSVAVSLALMKEVAVVSTDFVVDRKDVPEEERSLFIQALHLLKHKKDAARAIELKRRFLGEDKASLRALIVKVLAQGQVSIPTRKAKPSDLLSDLIITLDGKQHHFYSKAAKEFRERCFVSRFRVQKATKAYLLDALHKRNWARMKQRVAVPNLTIEIL